MTIVEKIVEYISWNGMDQKYRARKWIDYYSEKIYKILSERRIIKRSYIFDALFNIYKIYSLQAFFDYFNYYL